MKRRDFLAATAFFSFLASAPVEAAKKVAAKAKPVKRTAKTTQKSKAKASAKKPVAAAAAPAAPEIADEIAPEAQPETRNVISLPDEPEPQWRTYDIRSTIALDKVGDFEAALHSYMASSHMALIDKINESGDFDDAIESGLKAAIDSFKSTQSW